MNKSAGAPHDLRAHTLAAELRMLMAKLNRRLREQSHAGDLTGSQKTVLLHLEREGPATVTTLARTVGVRPQSMGATVAALQGAGLVSGAPDPADGRQTIWSVTPVFRKWIKDARAAREDWLFQVIQTRLAPREQETLAASIELFKRLAED